MIIYTIFRQAFFYKVPSLLMKTPRERCCCEIVLETCTALSLLQKSTTR